MSTIPFLILILLIYLEKIRNNMRETKNIMHKLFNQMKKIKKMLKEEGKAKGIQTAANS